MNGLGGIISKEEREFSTGKIGFLFGKYAIPGAICLLFIGVQSIIDGAFIGNYAGASALAGVNIAMPVFTLVSSLVIVVGIGCQTVIGISSGEGNYQKASDALRSAIVFLLLFTSSVAGCLLLFGDTIVGWLGADHTLHQHALSYIIALCPFFPLLSVLFLGDYFMKSQGKPYLSLIILSSAVLMNIILDYIFIAKMGLGTFGAGLATGVSFNLSALIVLPMMFNKSRNVRLQRGRFKAKLLGQMLYNGSSEGVSELSAGVAMFLFNISMMHYVGPVGVAAFTSINYMLYLGITVFVGMSDGIIPVMSYNFGAGNMSRVYKIVKFNVIVNLCIGVVLCFLAFFGGVKIVTLFFESSPDSVKTIELAVIGAKITAFAFLINGFNIAMSSFFTSMGDARSSVIISSLRGLVFITVGILIYPLILGVNGVWLAIPSADLLTLCVAMLLLKRKRKQLQKQ